LVVPTKIAKETQTQRIERRSFDNSHSGSK